MNKTSHMRFPFSNAKISSIRGGIMSGNGMGSVLLDGGIGGQSSYHSIDDYIETTGRNPYTGVIKRPMKQEGRGLSDKLANSLKALQIEKIPKKIKKNITMNF